MPCKSHPRARAGWTCAWCKEELCPDCVARQQAGFAKHDVCIRCGGPAAALRKLRADTPYLSRLGDAWKYPLQSNGLWAVAGAAVVLWLLTAIGADRWASAVLWAYVFSLIRANANGRTSIEAPDFSDLINDLVMPAVRGAVATAIVWVPAVLYLGFGRAEAPVYEPPPEQLSVQVAGDDPYARIFEQDGPAGAVEPEQHGEPEFPDELGEGSPEGLADGEAAAAAPVPQPPEVERFKPPPPPLHRDPILLLLVLLGVLYAPMALLVAATGGGLLQMLSPIHVVAYAARIPRDYGIAVGASALLAVAAVATGWVGAAVASLPIPVLAGIAGAAISTYVPFVTARVLGLLLWVHGATLGCLPPDEAWEPVLPGVEPRGAPPAVERPPEPDGPPAQAWQRPAAISLDEPELAPDANPTALLAAAASAGAGAAFMAIQEEPAPDPAAALAQAVAQGDFESAVELYRKLPALPVAALSAAAHFGVGRTAAFKGDYALAVRALKASIAAGPAEPDTPRAYVMLARIHAEKLGDPATAEKVYRFVAHRFPGTEAAKYAQERLGPRAGA